MILLLSGGMSSLIDEEDFAKLNIGTWRVRKNKNALYAVRSLTRGGRRTLYMHRFILDAPPELEVDHINGNGLDNRKSNLRLCSHSQNCMNTGKKKGSTSQFRGVRWDTKIKRWLVSCQGFYVGCFCDEKEAAFAYNIEAVNRFGPFARLNNVEQEDLRAGSETAEDAAVEAAR